MASNLVNDICIGQAKLCYIRASRLSETCVPSSGSSNVVISIGTTTLTASPEIEEGTEFDGKNGCGTLLFTAKDCDKIKQWNLTGEMITFDYELLELMFSATLIVGKVGSAFAGKSIGVAFPGKSSACPNGVSLEIWTQNLTGTGLCDVAEGTAALWTRHVFPRAILTPGDRTFEDDIARLAYTGFATENPNWGHGPFGDYGGVGTAPAASGYFQFQEDDLPFDPDDACGYLS